MMASYARSAYFHCCGAMVMIALTVNCYYLPYVSPFVTKTAWVRSGSDLWRHHQDAVKEPSIWRCTAGPRCQHQHQLSKSTMVAASTTEESSSDTTGASDCDGDSSVASTLPPGSTHGFFVVQTYQTPSTGFDMDQVKSVVSTDEVDRSDLTAYNLTVPIALMLLDPLEYPTRSRARKACRKANILIRRDSALDDIDYDPSRRTTLLEDSVNCFDTEKSARAHVGDRVYPGDVLAKQVRMGDGSFPRARHKKPPFDLPVLFEDDHFAIVNKPAGVVVYAHRGGGHGINTIRAALPFAITPSVPGTYATLRRPSPCHRLDKPTSGLLIIAKTKPAMVHLSQQFRDRTVKKTYTAIVNGIPSEPSESRISSLQASDLGVDVDPQSPATWQIIDRALDDKHAITIWRAIKYIKSLKADDNIMTLVELKPKTGRYHQLRRHMAWVCEKPLVGDKDYDGGGPAVQLRGRGLFLCSSRVTLQHPFYNSDEGRQAFKSLCDSERSMPHGVWISDNGTVMVTIEIELPEKFDNFLRREEDRFQRLAET